MEKNEAESSRWAAARVNVAIELQETPIVPPVDLLRSHGIKIYADHYRFLCKETGCPWLLIAKHAVAKASSRQLVELLGYPHNMQVSKRDLMHLLSPYGGRSTVRAVLSLGELYMSVEGVSECSMKDNFNRKRGFARALDRALSVIIARTKSSTEWKWYYDYVNAEHLRMVKEEAGRLEEREKKQMDLEDKIRQSKKLSAILVGLQEIKNEVITAVDTQNQPALGGWIDRKIKVIEEAKANLLI